MFQQLIKITLEFQGFKVLAADNGRSGLELAHAHPPHLILLDLMMPVMDGVAVCRAIMADPVLKNTPVLLLSSSNDSDEIETCLQMGAVDYLLKPFKPAMLVEVVRKYLSPKQRPRYEAPLPF
jgi:two-component system alkaline phosphatase synthesis response regulator PhoP